MSFGYKEEEVFGWFFVSGMVHFSSFSNTAVALCN